MNTKSLKIGIWFNDKVRELKNQSAIIRIFVSN